MDVILIVFCLCYIVIKTRTRTRKRGNATYIQTIKCLLHSFPNVFGICVEMCDMATDFLLAASLIIHNNGLGWISLMFAGCGFFIFVFKYSEYRKLIAGQATELRKELKNHYHDEEEMDTIISDISDREMDIHMLSLLNGCCEDVPQTLIVLIVNQNIAWNYLSILTITLSMVSFILKLCTVVATQFRCCDESIPQYEQLQMTDANK
eukprot:904962_1